LNNSPTQKSREEREEGGIGGDQEMDYSLAALKLLCVQLKDASETPSQNALTLGGILFQRAWLQVPPPLFIGSPFTPLPLPLCNSFPFCCCSQGILVSNDGDGRLLLDDGTGVIELCLSPDFRLRHWDSGITFPFLFIFSFWRILAYIGAF